MKKIYKHHILSFILSFFIFNALIAADIPPDKRQVRRVVIPEKKLERYRKDKDFDYVQKVDDENIFSKAFKWLVKKIFSLLEKFFKWLFGVKKGMKILKMFIKSLPYIAVLIFIYFIYRFLLGAELIRSGQNKRLKEAKVINLDSDDEIIKEADLDSLIREAVNDKDYRLAIRYYYLKALKKLIDNGLIEWHPDKTNRDYVNELKQKDLKSIFKHLTFIYDYIWYGKFIPTEEDFRVFKDDFNRFAV